MKTNTIFLLIAGFIFCWAGPLSAALPTMDLVIYLEAGSNVYTDTAGTVPAGNGDAVALWRDLASRGGFQEAVQAEASMRPTLITNAQNGQSVLRFEGDAWLFLQNNISGFLLDTDFLTWFVVYKGAEQGERVVLSARSTGTPATSYSWGYNFGGGVAGGFGRALTNHKQAAYSPVPYERYLIGSTEWNPFSGKVAHWLNGQGKTESPTYDSAIIIFDGLDIGAGANGYLPFTGDIAAILVYDNILLESERLAVEDYLWTKYNICDQPYIAASGPSPFDGGLMVPNGSLSWSPAAAVPGCAQPEEVSYNVALALDAAMTNVVDTWTGLNETTVAPVLQANTEYFWRVDAEINSAVLEGSVWSFTTTAFPVKQTITSQVPVMDGLVVRLDSQHVLVGQDNATLRTMAMLDQSGNENHAVAPPTYGPEYVEDALNGYPVVRFDGIEDHLDILDAETMDNISAITTFMVFRASDGWGHGDVPIQTAYSNHSRAWGVFVDSGNFRGQARNPDDSGISYAGTKPVVTDEWLVMEYWWDGDNVRGQWNGDYYRAASGATMTPQTHVRTRLMGSSLTHRTDFIPGDVAEILIYDRVLSDEERLEIGYYLANKYDIATLHADDGYWLARGVPPVDCEDIWAFQLDQRRFTDFTVDCKIDMADMAVLAEQWLIGK